MNNDFLMSYQTAEWQRLKYQVLERDNFTCQICGEKYGLMQVHHITYAHCRGKAYNAPMADLITLCEECHRHDDGDHVHFYNGDFYLSVGNDFSHTNPIVLDMRQIDGDYWFGFDTHIISWRFKSNNYRSIGFRRGSKWFEIALGVKGENILWFEGELDPHDAIEQRAADIDEVITFERAVEYVVLGFGCCIYEFLGEFFVDEKKYLHLKSIAMPADPVTDENKDLLF